MEDEEQDEEEEEVTSPWYNGKNSDFEDDVKVTDFEDQFDDAKIEEENVISKESDEIKVYRTKTNLQQRGLADAKPYNEQEIDDSPEDDEENISDMRFNKLREEMADVPDLDVEEEEGEEEEEEAEEKKQDDYRDKVIAELEGVVDEEEYEE